MHMMQLKLLFTSILKRCILHSHDWLLTVMVITPDSDSGNPGSIPGTTFNLNNKVVFLLNSLPSSATDEYFRLYRSVSNVLHARTPSSDTSIL